ncbi:hypothetical protein GGF31_000806 [Allomyces arbusculus]|nr:hypothetical protein GGF31_000806 [Allomyces arbusculus]
MSPPVSSPPSTTVLGADLMASSPSAVPNLTLLRQNVYHRYQLHPITLRFLDSAAETEYRAATALLSLIRNEWTMWMVAVTAILNLVAYDSGQPVTAWGARHMTTATLAWATFCFMLFFLVGDIISALIRFNRAVAQARAQGQIAPDDPLTNPATVLPYVEDVGPVSVYAVLFFGGNVCIKGPRHFQKGGLIVAIVVLHTVIKLMVVPLAMERGQMTTLGCYLTSAIASSWSGFKIEYVWRHLFAETRRDKIESGWSCLDLGKFDGIRSTTTLSICSTTSTALSTASVALTPPTLPSTGAAVPHVAPAPATPASGLRTPKISLSRPTSRARKLFFLVYDRVLADARANVQTMAAAAFVNDIHATGLVIAGSVPGDQGAPADPPRPRPWWRRFIGGTGTNGKVPPTAKATVPTHVSLSQTWLYRLLCRFPGPDEAMYQRQRSVPLRLEARYNIILATLSVIAELVIGWEHARVMLVEPGYQISIVVGWTVPCLWIRVVWTAAVQITDLVVPYLPLVKWNGTRLLVFNTATFVVFILQYAFAMWIELLNHNSLLYGVQAINLIRQLLFFSVESGVTTQYYIFGTSIVAVVVLAGGIAGPQPVRAPFMGTFLRIVITQVAGVLVARDVEHLYRNFYLGNNLFAVPPMDDPGNSSGPTLALDTSAQGNVDARKNVQVARSAPVLPDLLRYALHPITLRFLDPAVEDEYRNATAKLSLMRNEGIAWMVAVASIAHTAAYEMTLYPALTWSIWVSTRGICALVTFILAILLHRSRPLPGQPATAWAVRHMVPITLVWLAFCFLFYFWVGDTAAALINFTRGVADARTNGQIPPNDPVTDAAMVASFVPNTGPISAYAILFFGANVCVKGPRQFQKGALTLVVVLVHLVINVLVVPMAVERGQLTGFSCYLASLLASTWSSFKLEYIWRHLFAETRRDQIEAEWSCSDLNNVDGTRPRKTSAPPGLRFLPLTAPSTDADPPFPFAVPDMNLLRSSTTQSSTARVPRTTLARPPSLARTLFFAIYDRVLADARANVHAMAAAAYMHDVRTTSMIVADTSVPLPGSRARTGGVTRARRHAQPAAVIHAREALSHTLLYQLLCRFPDYDEAMYQRQRSVPLRLKAQYNIVLATLGVVAEMVLYWEHSHAVVVEPGYQIEVLEGWAVPCLWLRVVWTAVVQVVDLVVPYLPLVKWNGTRLLLFNTATFVAVVIQYLFAMWVECLNHNSVLSAVHTTNLIRQLLFFAVESGVTTQYYLLGTSAIAISVLLGGLLGPAPVRGPFMSAFLRTLLAQAAGAFVARDVEHMMRQFYLGNNLFAAPPIAVTLVDEGPPDGGKLHVSGGLRVVERSAPVLPSPTVMVVEDEDE